MNISRTCGLYSTPFGILDGGWEENPDDAHQKERGIGPRFVLEMKNKFLTMLVHLRHNLTERDLAICFGVSESTISRTFIRCINYVYLLMGSLPIWPSWEQVERSMPKCFKDSYPSTLSALLIPLNSFEVSASFQNRSSTPLISLTPFTKDIFAISPNGTIIFVSERFKFHQ